jgi:S1-C subfamily serine protease
MNILKFILVGFIFSTLLVADDKTDDQIKDAIVKIYTVSQVYNYKTPWNSRAIRFTGSGCIINGNRILTNAHVVANHTFIEVKKYGTTKRVQAKVLYVSHQADLALLSVDDKDFFKDVQPISFDGLPDVQQKVTVYGFPSGGNTLSVTSGIVSRIEHHRYAHGGERFLTIQIDAAVNPGNSGGPAVSNGKIVGVVMQMISQAQNIGYLVPTTMIRHFLDDIKDGSYEGFCDIGFATQKMESTSLRQMYGMDKNSTGQLIIELVYNSVAKDKLKVGDIITHIDGHRINNDATVEFRHHQFTYYKYYIDLHQIGEEVKLDIIRDKKPIKVSIKLKNIADDMLLVKTTRFDKIPKYFIYGGYVFVPLTKNLLNSGRSTTTKLRYLSSRWPTNEQKEIVVLLKVLASKISQGNGSMSLKYIKTVNGNSFSTFDEFYKIVESFKGDYLLIEDDDGLQIAIDTKNAKIQNDKILQRYNIKYDKSRDLVE